MPVTLFIFLCNLLSAQNPSDFLPEKPGKWSYLNNITSNETEYQAYKKNMASLAEWFHQNVPMLTAPKGYDMQATTYGQFDKYYKIDKCNYGLRDELHFSFQLFYSNGGKWTIEPPHYSFNVNNTETGHASSRKVALSNETKDDPALEKAINAAAVKMNGIFPAFEFVRQIAQGIDLYRESEDAYPHDVIIYDPEKQPYWLPVTVKELAALYIEYYALFKKVEIDLMLFEELKKEIANIPPEELDAQAFIGHESNVVFRINGRKEGMPLMRFNADYWDRTRPTSDIQFMTFYYPKMNEVQLEEFYKNNGHPFYSQLLVNQFAWNKIAELVKKGN
ncbi:MAG: hypothetical protein ACOYKE_09620 [Ferruginibacter sp.]